MELKSLPMELKAINEDGTFEAYGATFGNIDLGGDIIEKGAFSKTLAETSIDEVQMYWNHDRDQPIGEYTEIMEDEHGLRCKGRLYIEAIEKAKEVHFLMKKRKVKAFSIIYKAVKDAYEKGVRHLQEIKLHSIDPVTMPMNPKAVLLSVKSGELINKRDLERVLRDAGLCRQEAKAFMAEGWEGLQRDVNDQKNENELPNPPDEKKTESDEDWGPVVKMLEGLKL